MYERACARMRVCPRACVRALGDLHEQTNKHCDARNSFRLNVALPLTGARGALCYPLRYSFTDRVACAACRYAMHMRMASWCSRVKADLLRECCNECDPHSRD